MPPRRASSRGQPQAFGDRGGRGRGRGAGAPRDGSTAAQTSGPAVPAHIATVGVRRPDYGRAGRPINIIANAYNVKNSEGMVYHYDVVVAPDTLPSRFNMKLMQHLQTHVAPDIFTPLVVYDGKKNVFSPRLLPLGPTNSREFNVPSPEAGAQTGTSRPPRLYKITLTKVNEINTVVLQRFVEQQQSLDENVLTAIMALNVVVRMEPSQKYPFNVRSFFTSQQRRQVGGGLELWRGFFQSIRPAIGKLVLNVDISTGMMFKPGPLIGLCLEFLGRTNTDPKVLSPSSGMPDRERVRLKKFIAGIKVQVRGNKPGMQRTRVIRDLSTVGADQLQFDLDGKRTSVAKYFAQNLNMPLKFPTILCVEVGRGAMYPLEMCTVLEGQIARRQVPPDVTKQVVEFATMKPAERFQSIEQGVRLLAYGQSDYVRQFGLSVDSANGPIVVPARVLQPPKLQYGPGSKERSIGPRNGAWNMQDKKFYKPVAINQWILMIYERQQRFKPEAVQKMIQDFVSACASVGMAVNEKNPIVKYEQGQGDIIDQLKRAGGECMKTRRSLPNLIVVVLPDNGDDIYRVVKYFGDISVGVATQCLKSGKVFRANLQYWANVLLKVNVKLGGINLIPDQSSVAVLTDPRNPTIVMGADVMHPGPGAKNIPSYASLVASVDSNTSKYIPAIRVQASRQELIEDLEEMCKFAIGKYKGYRSQVEKTTTPPQRLIFYRDGVSEGQFDQVLKEELPKIRSACESSGFKPKITLIVVGKRHHFRFKTQNENDADRSGNCPAGTVVDKEIVHPLEFDWFLQSHGGLLGTSRPSHYSVIYDDNNFK
ncbi:hypothetical protein AX17_006353 [Amanita inopinata Kibby_2008]|nr:hypothetical protein AX17_006353 [Amanita inopinata Kibby_2008]